MTGRSSHILLIANIPPGKAKVTISAFRFLTASRKYENGLIELVEEYDYSHDHLGMQQQLEDLKFEEDDKEEQSPDSTLKNTPLPSATLQSTESTNVIELV